MKQILSAILIMCLLLFPVSSLGNFDFSTMTDEELKQFIVLAQAELYSRQEKADEAALKKDGVLSIKETGFLKYDDRIHVAFIVHNNLSDKAIREPDFRVTFRDGKGDVIAVKSVFCYEYILPGEDFAVLEDFSSDSIEETPVSMEVEYTDPVNDYNCVPVSSLKYADAIPLSIASVNLKKDCLVGEIYNPNSYDIDHAWVSVVFRNKNGQLLGGALHLEHTIKAGKKTAFDFSYKTYHLKGIVKDYYEVYCGIQYGYHN